MAKILIADDDLAAVDRIAPAITGEGHEVLLARDGQEALEMTLAELPDLVFLSPTLPIFNGFETSTRLRDDPEVPERLPVIMLLTKQLDPRTIEQAGITDVLPKRHTTTQLRDLLVKHLGDKAAV